MIIYLILSTVFSHYFIIFNSEMRCELKYFISAPISLLTIQAYRDWNLDLDHDLEFSQDQEVEVEYGIRLRS